jgi:hypothetical protein
MSGILGVKVSTKNHIPSISVYWSPNSFEKIYQELGFVWLLMHELISKISIFLFFLN